MTAICPEVRDRFGLKPHTISAIQRVFAKHSRVERAVLYGSRAKGNYRPGSDIADAIRRELDLCRPLPDRNGNRRLIAAVHAGFIALRPDR